MIDIHNENMTNGITVDERDINQQVDCKAWAIGEISESEQNSKLKFLEVVSTIFLN